MTTEELRRRRYQAQFPTGQNQHGATVEQIAVADEENARKGGMMPFHPGEVGAPQPMPAMGPNAGLPGGLGSGTERSPVEQGMAQGHGMNAMLQQAVQQPPAAPQQQGPIAPPFPQPQAAPQQAPQNVQQANQQFDQFGQQQMMAPDNAAMPINPVPSWATGNESGLPAPQNVEEAARQEWQQQYDDPANMQRRAQEAAAAILSIGAQGPREMAAAEEQQFQQEDAQRHRERLANEASALGPASVGDFHARRRAGNEGDPLYNESLRTPEQHKLWGSQGPEAQNYSQPDRRAQGEDATLAALDTSAAGGYGDYRIAREQSPEVQQSHEDARRQIAAMKAGVDLDGGAPMARPAAIRGGGRTGDNDLLRQKIAEIRASQAGPPADAGKTPVTPSVDTPAEEGPGDDGGGFGATALNVGSAALAGEVARRGLKRLYKGHKGRQKVKADKAEAEAAKEQKKVDKKQKKAASKARSKATVDKTKGDAAKLPRGLRSRTAIERAMGNQDAVGRALEAGKKAEAAAANKARIARAVEDIKSRAGKVGEVDPRATLPAKSKVPKRITQQVIPEGRDLGTVHGERGGKASVPSKAGPPKVIRLPGAAQKMLPAPDQVQGTGSPEVQPAGKVTAPAKVNQLGGKGPEPDLGATRPSGNLKGDVGGRVRATPPKAASAAATQVPKGVKLPGSMAGAIGFAPAAAGNLYDVTTLGLELGGLKEAEQNPNRPEGETYDPNSSLWSDVTDNTTSFREMLKKLVGGDYWSGPPEETGRAEEAGAIGTRAGSAPGSLAMPEGRDATMRQSPMKQPQKEPTLRELQMQLDRNETFDAAQVNPRDLASRRSSGDKTLTRAEDKRGRLQQELSERQKKSKQRSKKRTQARADTRATARSFRQHGVMPTLMHQDGEEGVSGLRKVLGAMNPKFAAIDARAKSDAERNKILSRQVDNQGRSVDNEAQAAKYAHEIAMDPERQYGSRLGQSLAGGVEGYSRAKDDAMFGRASATGSKEGRDVKYGAVAGDLSPDSPDGVLRFSAKQLESDPELAQYVLDKVGIAALTDFLDTNEWTPLSKATIRQKNEIARALRIKGTHSQPILGNPFTTGGPFDHRQTQ